MTKPKRLQRARPAYPVRRLIQKRRSTIKQLSPHMLPRTRLSIAVLSIVAGDPHNERRTYQRPGLLRTRRVAEHDRPATTPSPASGDTDGVAEVISLDARLPPSAAVQAGGKPSFDLRVGNDTRKVVGSSDSGTGKLTFSYPVQLTDRNDDGTRMPGGVANSGDNRQNFDHRDTSIAVHYGEIPAHNSRGMGAQSADEVCGRRTPRAVEAPVTPESGAMNGRRQNGQASWPRDRGWPAAFRTRSVRLGDHAQSVRFANIAKLTYYRIRAHAKGNPRALRLLSSSTSRAASRPTSAIQHYRGIMSAADVERAVRAVTATHDYASAECAATECRQPIHRRSKGPTQNGKQGR